MDRRRREQGRALGLGVVVTAAALGAAACGDDTPPDPTFARAEPVWVKRLPSAELAEFQTVAAAARDGEIVAGGYFRGPVDLGGGELQAAGEADAFVAAYRADGTLRWLRTVAGPGADDVAQVVVAPGGTIYVTGAVGGAARLFGMEVDGGAGTSAFVARLDADGELLWARLGAGANGQAQAGASLALVDGGTDAGGVVVAGDFAGTIDFGGGPGVAGPGGGMFLTRLDEAGGHRWTRVFNGGFYEAVQRVAVGPDGSVALLSRVDGVIDFGGGAIEGGTETSRPLLLARFDGGDGALRWSQLVTPVVGHDEHEHMEDSRSLAVRADGVIHVAMSFRHGLEHGFEAPQPPFLRFGSFRADGASLRDDRDFFARDSLQRDGGMVVDAAGTAHLAGSFQGGLSVDGESALVTPGSRYLFLLDLSAAGEVTRADAYGDGDTSLVIDALAIDPAGFTTTAGYWRAAGTAEIHPFLARFQRRGR